jgi:hypothetical protein
MYYECCRQHDECRCPRELKPNAIVAVDKLASPPYASPPIVEVLSFGDLVFKVVKDSRLPPGVVVVGRKVFRLDGDKLLELGVIDQVV